MAHGRYLEKLQKIVISRPRFKLYRRNLTRWRSSTLSTALTVKNLNFQQSKLAAAAIFKNRKIALHQPRFERFRQNSAKWCSSTLLIVLTVKDWKLYKSRMAAAARLLEKLKNRHFSAAVWAICTQFGTLTQFELLNRCDYKKLQF